MLKKKSKVLNTFKKFKSLAEVEKEVKILCLRTDKGRCKPIGLKWVFKVKKNPKREILKHKVYGVVFTDMFVPIASLETTRQ
ncbi:unnamed protein product [Spirodela intermedia]|uniref:Uncharacterized protein n=1 Tax=Spirodela intermedia TaxID=51605 RepID=A0A7I8IY24_SPIIN|nr:unnamed protein product [Spirodela intermedia]CAA6662758.1 unnamed protein product [Spirodela intermedia]